MTSERAKTLRDRTNEYRSLTAALRKRQQNSPPANLNPNSVRPKNAFSEFSRHASAIGKDIQETAALLEQLAMLARGKTIFDDKTNEINTLTSQVKQRIATINGKILSLQTLQRQKNGQNGRGSQQAAEHHSNIVVSLQSQLANTSTVFKDVLELRSESLKESGTRKEKFIGTATSGAVDNAPFTLSGVRNRRRNDDYNNHVDSPLYQTERKMPDYRNAMHTSGSGESDDFVALSLPDMDASSSSQMMLMQQNQSSYLDTRSDAIASIESTISELGSIFQQLAHMVSEQRDVVQRIDANVESIDANISAAQNELLRFYSNISSNRWLMAKIFMVILVFVFLLVTFV
ncbi:Integral membrane protein SED5 [Coemansia spiralis]|uniref:Integral membrane protein SED5 n=2 Tax=Coemansia TaxID=4863 RepID=A0A9W8GBT9_9FUNG|nr:Integral membrane protein SED5 [Coemansia umbellata]KAJ2622770.1 Integral membrane protein SED5 [Coemansia sp. RSA 1358]KAJ2679018.1 Integral membrane protein SED5 [Coemansia spiralis]